MGFRIPGEKTRSSVLSGPRGQGGRIPREGIETLRGPHSDFERPINRENFWNNKLQQDRLAAGVPYEDRIQGMARKQELLDLIKYEDYINRGMSPHIGENVGYRQRMQNQYPFYEDRIVDTARREDPFVGGMLEQMYDQNPYRGYGQFGDNYKPDISVDFMGDSLDLIKYEDYINRGMSPEDEIISHMENDMLGY